MCLTLAISYMLAGVASPLVSYSCSYTFFNPVSRSCTRAILDSVPTSVFLSSYDVLNSKLHLKKLKLYFKKNQPIFYQKRKMWRLYIITISYLRLPFFLVYLFFILFLSKHLISFPLLPCAPSVRQLLRRGLWRSDMG